jgi:hypothetical protein
MATMPKKNQKRRDLSGAATSMPQIRGPPPKYLTKKDDNQEFHKQYSKRLTELTQKKERISDALEELKLSLRRLAEEEETAAMSPAGKQKLKRLIPIYQEQRETKDHIKQMTDELKKLNQHIERVQNLEKSLHLRERIFEDVNLDPNRGKKKMDFPKDPEDYYLDKKIDVAKLRKIKRGMYLDILETSVSNGKLTFGKNEKKYDLEKIIEYQKQYAIDNQLRLEHAAFKHKMKLQKQEARVLQMKLLRNLGQYNPNRDSLYPNDDDDYEDLVDYRGASARSSAERNFTGRLLLYLASKRAGSAIPREDSYDKKLEELLKRRGKMDEMSAKTGGGGMGTLAAVDSTVSRNQSAHNVNPKTKKNDLDIDFMDAGSKLTGGSKENLEKNHSGLTDSHQQGSKPKLFGNTGPTTNPQLSVKENHRNELTAPQLAPLKKFTTGDEEKIGDMSFKPITEGKYPVSQKDGVMKPKPANLPIPSTIPKPADPKPTIVTPAAPKPNVSKPAEAKLANPTVTVGKPSDSKPQNPGKSAKLEDEDWGKAFDDNDASKPAPQGSKPTVSPTKAAGQGSQGGKPGQPVQVVKPGISQGAKPGSDPKVAAVHDDLDFDNF